VPNGPERVFTGVKGPELEADHLLPSVEIKIDWSYVSYPSIRLFGSQRDRFISNPSVRCLWVSESMLNANTQLRRTMPERKC
jgi:hypothetical protein